MEEREARRLVAELLRISTNYLSPKNGQNKEQVMGIEPTLPAWEAGVLPMNYTCRRRLSDAQEVL